VTFNTNFHAIDNSQLRDNAVSERIMSQSNSDLDPSLSMSAKKSTESNAFPSIKEATVSTIS
jgi:hypothetical protein